MIGKIENEAFDKDVECCDGIVLKAPELEYAEDILRFRREIFDANDRDAFAGCSGLEKADTVAGVRKWIKSVKAMEKEETCPKDKVPSNVYIAVRLSDNKIVGITDLRHHINTPILSTWGGHIGYSVRPDERGKGYGREMLRQNLLNCKELGLKRVMVTCNHNNRASERIILENGGVFEKEIEVDKSLVKRYWIEV